jgi:site-specific DNA-adenine methylase
MSRQHPADLTDILNDNAGPRSDPPFSSSQYYDAYELNGLLSQVKTKEYLSIMNTNARSLPRHISDYQLFLEALYEKSLFEFDLITFDETWLNNDLEQIISLNNYDAIFQHKINKKEGGGLCVFIKSDLTYISRPDLSISDEFREKFDVLFLEVIMSQRSNNYVIGIVYRSPSNNSEKDFIACLTAILEKVEMESKHIIIVGDMNLDLLKADSHKHTGDYLASLISNGFVPAITLPTRITQNSCTLIDHIFIKSKLHTFLSGTITTDITDHYINFILCPLKPVTTKNKYITYRQFNEENLRNLENALTNHNWSSVIQCTDVNTSYSNFIEEFVEEFDRIIPQIKKRFNKYHHKKEPWITKGLLSSIRTRDRMHSKLRKIQNESTREIAVLSYKKYKNILNKLIKESKRGYWETTFDKCKNDTKATWKQINEVLNRSRKTSDLPDLFHHNNTTFCTPHEISNGFNGFYTNLGPSLSSSLPQTSHNFKTFFGINNYPNSFFLQPTTEQEVINVIRNMKAKTSSGIDLISPKLMQSTSPGIATPLTHIINLSLINGQVPTQMKAAKVIPIYKSGDSKQLVNYRPISLLPSFSKVLERIVYNQLYSYLKRNNILSKSQYGFQESLSTEMAILELQDRIASALSSGSWCLGIFLDLSKAFDTINHNILIEKLALYGIRGIALSWFRSYLTNRTQVVKVKDVQSDPMYISCGVPQGSILGPLLFLVYINDIINVIESGNPVLFADDTNVLYTDKNLTTLQQVVNQELENISEWFICNKLSVNASKTKCILFHRKKQNSANIQVTLRSCIIERVPSLKFLGIIIQENLCWKTHIEYLHKKIAKCLGVLHRLKHQLPEYILLQIYNSLIASHISYGIAIWGDALSSDKKRIHIMQKKAMRCICKTRYNCHTNPLFLKHKQLKVDDMYLLGCCKIYYRYKANILPNYHSLQFQLNYHHQGVHTRQSCDIYIPFARSKISRQCLIQKVGQAWNSLPVFLKNYQKSLLSFNKNVKKHLLSQYNTNCNKPNCFSCASI